MWPFRKVSPPAEMPLRDIIATTIRNRESRSLYAPGAEDRLVKLALSFWRGDVKARVDRLCAAIEDEEEFGVLYACNPGWVDVLA